MKKLLKYVTVCMLIGVMVLNLTGCSNMLTIFDVMASFTSVEKIEDEIVEEIVDEIEEEIDEEIDEDIQKKKRRDFYKKVPMPTATSGNKILFVGNSHTYVNDVPGVFAQLASAAGYEVEVYELSEGMYTLEQFSDPEDELGAILDEALTNENWDFVILQEKSHNAIYGNVEEYMYPYAKNLDEKIRAAGGQTAFMMTFPLEGQLFILDFLSKGYQGIAEELDALLIPGGEVFMEASNRNSNLELLGEDGQHASEEGAYLAACCVYTVLFQESPEGNSYLSSLDEETANEIQAIVAEMILTE